MTYIFDLSLIPATQNEPFFLGVKQLAMNGVVTLGFSMDTGARADLPDDLLLDVADSIASRCAHAVHNVVVLICYLLGKTTRVENIQLSHLAIPDPLTQQLCKALARRPVALMLQHCSIDMSVFLGGCDPDCIDSLVVRNCGITVETMEDIRNFLHRRRTGRIMRVSFAELSAAADEEVRDLLLHRVTRTWDAGDPRFARRSDELRRLESERAALEMQLGRVREISTKPDGVYVVGERVNQFVAWLETVETRLRDADRSLRLFS